MEFYFFALGAHGTGISGGDRILMELARRWRNRGIVNIYLWEEGMEMCKRNYLVGKGIKFHISNIKFAQYGFIINYFARILEGIRLGLTIKLKCDEYLYSASDFWMDVLPSLILKLRYPEAKWVSGWYQTAPNPFKGYQGRYRISSFFYYLSQFPIKPLIARYSDFVYVNNESERQVFSWLNQKGRVFVFIGAVDLNLISIWKKKFKNLPKVYDGVFQGRYHPQKGVVELVDIWKLVVKRKSNAKLAMIGDGPLMEKVKFQIKKNKLQKNIDLFGYLFDGPQKYRIFSQSKIVLHPAFYDSGGMAAAEAMAFGLPCVGFDLPAYKSYYPKGMLKVKLGNLKAFSETIEDLIHNKVKRKKVAKDAVKMINDSWSWDKRAKEALEFIHD